MKRDKVIIYVTSSLLGLGLKVQFESLGFSLVELVDSSAQTLASTRQQLPALIILDTAIQEAELDCFSLARLLQEVNDSIPIIFFDKTTEEFQQLGPEQNTLVPYSPAWTDTPALQQNPLPVPVEAEQELLESKQLLQSVFDASPSGIIVLKSVRDEQGEIIDFEYVLANRATRIAKMGIDILGKRYSQVHTGVKQMGLFQFLKEVVETGEERTTEIYYAYDGLDNYYQVQGVKLDDGVVYSFQDITPRKKAEQQVKTCVAELKENQELLRSVIAAVPVRVSVLKAVRNESGQIVDFKFMLANPATEKGTGRDDLVGKHLFEIYGPAKKFLWEGMVRALETGQMYSTEFFYPYQGFNSWHCNRYVKFDDGVVETNEDITPRKKAEAEILKNFTLLRQAEEVGELGSWEYDVATKEFCWSEGMYRLFGISPSSRVSPQIYLDYVIPEDQPIAKKINRWFGQGRQPLEETLRLRVNQQVRTVRVKGTVLHNPEGQPVKKLGVDLDITHVKRLEAENLALGLTQQKALLLAILEAQQEERRRIAESLHNGVGQILYSTKLNLDRIKLSPEQSRPDSPEKQALQKVEQLLTEAISETRRVSFELVPVLLQDFGLEAALRELCQQASSSTLRLECQVKGIPHRLESHLELALYRISQELVNNLVRHSGASQGSLLVSRQGKQILLQLKDNGQGFEPEQEGGKGLGIRTIQNWVRLLNGTLVYKTSPGKGVEVTICIPIN